MILVMSSGLYNAWAMADCQTQVGGCLILEACRYSTRNVKLKRKGKRDEQLEYLWDSCIMVGDLMPKATVRRSWKRTWFVHPAPAG